MDNSIYIQHLMDKSKELQREMRKKISLKYYNSNDVCRIYESLEYVSEQLLENNICPRCCVKTHKEMRYPNNGKGECDLELGEVIEVYVCKECGKIY